MDTDNLATALRACATGIYAVEAGVALLIGNGTFLRRDDFTARFIEHGTSGGIATAAIDWQAAVTSLAAGGPPMLRRRTPHPPTRRQPCRRHPSQPPRHRHRPR
jgi:hypothetical protein